jgi:hypothetical protein
LSTIERLRIRAEALAAEANACVGEEVAFVAATQINGAETSRGTVRSYSVLGAPVVAIPSASPSPSSAPSPPRSDSPYATDAPHEASMLAYSADLTLAVFQVASGMTSVEAIATDVGGYLWQRTDAQVTVRVPRPRFEEAMRRIEMLGDVLHRNVAAEDVTDEFVDLALRLKNALATRDRLLALMKDASVKDALEIERELTKVTETIETIEGRLKLLRDRVGFSTLAVYFQASSPLPVRTIALLPFPWLDIMGLSPLLRVTVGEP